MKKLVITNLLCAFLFGGLGYLGGSWFWESRAQEEREKYLSANLPRNPLIWERRGKDGQVIRQKGKTLSLLVLRLNKEMKGEDWDEELEKILSARDFDPADELDAAFKLLFSRWIEQNPLEAFAKLEDLKVAGAYKAWFIRHWASLDIAAAADYVRKDKIAIYREEQASLLHMISRIWLNQSIDEAWVWLNEDPEFCKDVIRTLSNSEYKYMEGQDKGLFLKLVDRLEPGMAYKDDDFHRYVMRELIQLDESRAMKWMEGLPEPDIDLSKIDDMAWLRPTDDMRKKQAKDAARSAILSHLAKTDRERAKTLYEEWTTYTNSYVGDLLIAGEPDHYKAIAWLEENNTSPLPRVEKWIRSNEDEAWAWISQQPDDRFKGQVMESYLRETKNESTERIKEAVTVIREIMSKDSSLGVLGNFFYHRRSDLFYDAIISCFPEGSPERQKLTKIRQEQSK